MVCQCRKALRRHSSRKGGSFFLEEISRTVSSVNPGGALSDSTSVTKPYLYSFLTRPSMVSVAVLIWSVRWVDSLRRLKSCRGKPVQAPAVPPVYFFGFEQAGQRP